MILDYGRMFIKLDILKKLESHAHGYSKAAIAYTDRQGIKYTGVYGTVEILKTLKTKHLSITVS